MSPPPVVVPLERRRERESPSKLHRRVAVALTVAYSQSPCAVICMTERETVVVTNFWRYRLEDLLTDQNIGILKRLAAKSMNRKVRGITEAW
ncbi:hypothetical protein QQF64_000760 [Cirrhinus molitorella]|uniref:Uncharacterized protein n=1 Tax=Cirrhinus molitorella TaxID=172907 RepID=A0ABR3NY46_9TELE